MKRKIFLSITMGAILGLSSCSKFLDVNTNPNEPTSAPPTLILPQALVATANQVNGYNTTGAQIGGYMANAGGYGGFGSAVTYSFSASDHAGRWGFYDVLNDYQLVINGSTDASQILFKSVATIMRAHGFQCLVDQYNSVPYFQALNGTANLTPKYDDPKVIYKDLADQLDKAIADIKAAKSATIAPTALNKSTDPLFKGDLDMWLKFANTLKLRILIVGGDKVAFSTANKTFDPIGFLTTDALVNPTFQRLSGKQNPKWATWGFTETGGDANKAWMPNTFVITYYTGVKLSDPGRGAAIYYGFPSTTYHNRLGVESNDIKPSPSGSFWYPSSNRDGKTAGSATGVLKGPEAGVPIITASESYFLQAEAALRGIITGGNVQQLFEKGIEESFKYLYSKPDGSMSGTPSTDAASYLSLNNTSKLVNFTLATTTAEKLEAIITQKYIAMNMVNSDQGWNDYRRTGYPKLNNAANATGSETFASSQSKMTTPDKLPTRILYPTSEGAFNSTNVPKNIDVNGSKIFWAAQ